MVTQKKSKLETENPFLDKNQYRSEFDSFSEEITKVSMRQYSEHKEDVKLANFGKNYSSVIKIPMPKQLSKLVSDISPNNITKFDLV